MTAYHAIAVAGAAPGVTLLIAGGAGAVGHYAVQFAKAAGALVIATISSPEKADAARAAGADHTIDYRRENVGERVMAITGKKGVDAVVELDFAANAKLAPQVLRERGTIVIYGTGAPQSEIPGMFFLRNAITLKYIYVYELNAAERRRGARCHHARPRNGLHHLDRQDILRSRILLPPTKPSRAAKSSAMSWSISVDRRKLCLSMILSENRYPLFRIIL